MAMDTNGKQTQIVTGICRWAYVNVCKPRASAFGGKPKYSVVLIIPKADTATLDKVNVAITTAYEVGKIQLKRGSMTIPELSEISTPLHDGDIERPGEPVYADSIYLKASSIALPVIVNADNRPISDDSEIYSGVYGRAKISFYTYNFNDCKGVACGLHSLMKVHDGEHLGNLPVSTLYRPSAQSDFCNLDS